MPADQAARRDLAAAQEFEEQQPDRLRVTGFFVVMPSIIFSGLGTPVSSMPPVMQWICEFNPLGHFLVVLRGLYLKGVGLDVLWPNCLAMALIGTALLVLTTTRLRKSLDSSGCCVY